MLSFSLHRVHTAAGYLALVSGTFLSLIGSTSAATPVRYVYGLTQVGATATPGCVPGVDYSGPLSCTDTNTVSQGQSTGTVKHTLDPFGRVGLYASSFADYSRLDNQDGGLQRSFTYSNGTFTDWLTISGGGRQGTGQLTFAVDFTFGFDTGLSTAAEVSTAVASIDARVTVEIAGRTFGRMYTYQEREDRGVIGVAIRNVTTMGSIDGMQATLAEVQGLMQYTIDFQFDTPFMLSFDSKMYSFAQASGVSTAFATLDSMNSLKWGGVDSVRVDGNEVAFTISSASGTDYAAPVPEPGSLLLALLGLGFLGLRWRAQVRSVSGSAA
jgi:hypothetical protein